MKIILTQEVRNIGAPGDVVDVADGYARNYLIPRGVALRATKGTLKQVDTIRRTREVREIRNLEQAQQIAQQLAALKIRVRAKAGDGGRLFGQVTPAQIAEAIAKAEDRQEAAPPRRAGEEPRCAPRAPAPASRG